MAAAGREDEIEVRSVLPFKPSTDPSYLPWYRLSLIFLYSAVIDKFKGLACIYVPNLPEPEEEGYKILDIVHEFYFDNYFDYRKKKYGLKSVYKDIPVQFPKRKCRFHCIPIKIFELYDTNHSILLVYDSLSDKLEIFDPRGSKTPFKHFSDYFGDLIKFVRSLIGIDLSSTIVVPIKNEVQCAIRKSRVRKGIPTWSKHPDEDGKLLEFAKILREEFEPIGYCSAWSIWLLYLRLENPDSDIEELIALANEEIDKFGENPIMWGLVKEGVELARKFETEEMSFEIVHDRSVSHARQTFSLKQSRFIKDKIWPTIFKFDESPYEEEIEVSTIEKF